MSEDSQEFHNSGLLYFMPHWIFESPELSSTDKLVYALLSGLAFGNTKKECFPSDEYIAQRLGLGREQANRSVGALYKFGALEKRVASHPKNAFRKIRYITLNLELKKSLRSDENVTPDGDENVTLRSDKKVTYSNKGNSNKEKKESVPTPSEIATPPFCSKEFYDSSKKMAEFFFDKLRLEYPKILAPKIDSWALELDRMHRIDNRSWVEIEIAIEYALKDSFWKSNILSPGSLRKNYDKIYAQMINKNQSKENIAEENAKWAKEVESKMRHVARCHASTDSFVFEGVGNYSGEYIKYSESGFKERIINRLRKMGLIDYLKDD